MPSIDELIRLVQTPAVACGSYYNTNRGYWVFWWRWGSVFDRSNVVGTICSTEPAATLDGETTVTFKPTHLVFRANGVLIEKQGTRSILNNFSASYPETDMLRPRNLHLALLDAPLPVGSTPSTPAA